MKHIQGLRRPEIVAPVTFHEPVAPLEARNFAPNFNSEAKRERTSDDNEIKGGQSGFEVKANEREIFGQNVKDPGGNETDFGSEPGSSRGASRRSSASESVEMPAEEAMYIVPTTTSDGTMSGPGGESVQAVGETLEERQFGRMMTDAVALGAARGLAGMQTNKAVGGYLGERGVGNEDVLNSAATGTARNPRTGGPVPPEERKGDAFTAAKEAHNTSTDTLRPSFGIAPPNGVIPPKTDQIRSDILFSDFSVVAPGNGLGVTNKMFLMEEYRQKNFVYKEPLAEPRAYEGPTCGVVPPPIQWQNQITRRDRNTIASRSYAAEASGVLLENRTGEGSLNILGDDYGLMRGISDKGLKRHRESPLEPVILTPKAWERVKPLPGFQWDRKEQRRLFDAERYPERFTPHLAMEGGPTMSTRNALAVFPFPITSQ